MDLDSWISCFIHLRCLLFRKKRWLRRPLECPRLNSFYLHRVWHSLGEHSFNSLIFLVILSFDSHLFMPAILVILSFDSHLFMPAKTLQNGLSVDPCTPTGFSHTSESEAPSPSVMMVERNSRYNISSFHSKGNFSECRSVALMLLQKGKGCTNLHMLHFLKPFSYRSFFQNCA